MTFSRYHRPLTFLSLTIDNQQSFLSGLVINKDFPYEYSSRLVYRYGITDALPEGTEWKELSKASHLSKTDLSGVTDVAVTSHPALWFLNRGKLMHARLQIDKNTGDVAITRLNGLSLDDTGDSVIRIRADASGSIWCMTTEGRVYVLDGDGLRSPDEMTWYPVIRWSTGIDVFDMYPSPTGIYVMVGVDRQNRRGKYIL